MRRAAVLGAVFALVAVAAVPVPNAAAAAPGATYDILVIGGPGAVEDQVLDRLAQFTSGAVTRLAGSTRYGTAAAVSAASFAPGAPVAYLTTGLDYADAVPAGPVAAQQGGPVLLVTRDGIPAATRTELLRLAPARIVVVGGTAVISEAVVTQLAAYTAGGVTRIAGPDRYGTAAALSAAAFPAGATRAFVATGLGFPDGNAAGSKAAVDGGPLLLTRPDVLPAATRNELIRLAPDEVVVVGGPAVVSDAVLAEIGRWVTGTVRRIAGPERYATAAAVSADTFDPGPAVVYIATGFEFADGLAAVPAAGTAGAPLLFVRPYVVPSATSAELNRLGSNTAPVATEQSVSTPEDTALPVVLSATDPQGDPLTFAVTTTPAHGTLTGTVPNLIYTPDADYHGPDSFQFTAADAQLTSLPASIEITVTAVNDAPVAVADGYTTPEDTQLVVNGVLDNDTDIDGDPLTAVLETDVFHGTLALAADGTFTYDPDPDYNGPDSFTYRASDGTAQSAPATVSLTIGSAPDAPSAVDDGYSTPEDIQLVVSAATGVLSNDTDADSDPLTAVLATDVTHGTLALASDGSFTYDPDADYHGPDSFTYRASDGTSQSAPATVAITVDPVNDPPVADDQSVSTLEDVPLGITLTGSDVEMSPLTFAVAAPPGHGSLSGTAPNLVYTPALNYNGPDSFTFTANDGTDDSLPATISITVAPNGPPTAMPDAYDAVGNTLLEVGVTPSGDPAVTATGSVLDNDVDDGIPGPLSIGGFDATSANGGTVAMAADGTFTYLPAAGYSGVDTFDYTVTDGDDSATGTVTITIADVVWYIDNSVAGPGTGRSGDPFSALAAVNGPGDADGAGDILFLYAGSGPYSGGLTLEADQTVRGEASGLTVGIHGLVPAGSRPEITGAPDAVAIPDGGALSTVSGLRLSPATGGAAVRVTSATQNVSLDDLVLIAGTDPTDAGLRLAAVTGDVTATGLDIDSLAGSATGIRIDGGAGTHALGGTLDHQSVGPAVWIGGGHSGMVTFDDGAIAATVGTGLQFDNADGTYAFDDTVTLNGDDAGIDILAGSTGTFTFAAATITNPTGAAFNVDTGAPTITYTGSITNGAAETIRVAGTTGGTATFQGGSVQDSGGSGILLTGSGGTFTVSGAYTATGAGAGVTITNSAGSAGFNGGVTITNPTGTAISLTSSTGSASFTDLDIDTTGQSGLVASGFGMIDVGGTSTIDVTGAPAVDLASSGPGTLTFASLSSTGSTGAGIDLDAFSGSFTVTGAATVDTSTGAGIDLNGANGTISFGSVDIDGTTGPGIEISGNSSPVTVTGGTVGATTPAGAAGVDLAGGTGDVSIGAAITGGAAHRTVEVTGRTGGTATFSGAVDENGVGIFLDSNTGGTVAFTGSIDVDTATDPGFTATNGGTVTVAGGTIDTTTGLPIRIHNVTIGAGGVTLTSINTNGSVNGIVLTNTGTGPFEVTGDGPSDPANLNRGRTTDKLGGGTLVLGSGGTLSTTTASSVLLSNASNVTLRNMVLSSDGAGSRDGVNVTGGSNLTLDNTRISGFSDHAVRATGLTGLTLTHMDIETNAKSADSIANDEANLKTTNLAGTALIQNSRIRDVHQDNVRVSTCETAPCGVTLALTFDNVWVADTLPGAGGNDGVLVRTFNDGHVDLSVDNSLFTDNRANGIQHNTNDADSTGSTTVTDSIFYGETIDINVAHQGTGTHSFTITGNTLRNQLGTVAHLGNAINMFLAGGSTATSVLSGTIAGNTIGSGSVADSGSTSGNGIDLFASGAGTLTAAVTGNTIRALMFGSALRAQSSSHTGTLNLTAASNDFSVLPNTSGGAALAGLELGAGAAPGDTGTMCAAITGNTAFTGDTFWAGAFIQTSAGNPLLELVGYGGAANDQAAIEAFLDGAATTVTPAAAGSFTTFLGAGTVQGRVAPCPLP